MCCYKYVIASTHHCPINGIFPFEPQYQKWSVGKPEAKYGVSHFWLCGWQYGVSAWACVLETRYWQQEKATGAAYQYLFCQFMMTVLERVRRQKKNMVANLGGAFCKFFCTKCSWGHLLPFSFVRLARWCVRVGHCVSEARPWQRGWATTITLSIPFLLPLPFQC